MEGKYLVDGELADFCRTLFADFSRSDQRVWGEVYLRGLLEVPGRKSVARIAEHCAGPYAIQRLQQFLNQSPWDHVRVRQYLAQQFGKAHQTIAWSLDEVAFPKYGQVSVGVARQYSASLGQVLNCQIAVALSAVAEQAALPVNWRLALPPNWDEDTELRRKAHLPATERPRPRWLLPIEQIDEATEDWGLPALPVLADLRHELDVESLLRALEARGIGYLCQVPPSCPVRGGAVRPGQRRGPTALQLATASAERVGRMTISWNNPVDGRRRQSQFLAVPIAVGARSWPAAGSVRQVGDGRRVLLVHWPTGRARPAGYWLTNLECESWHEPIALWQTRRRVAATLTEMRAEGGLTDFEGRSFQGWHHHVTLASAAQGYRAIQSAALLDRV